MRATEADGRVSKAARRGVGAGSAIQTKYYGRIFHPSVGPSIGPSVFSSVRPSIPSSYFCEKQKERKLDECNNAITDGCPMKISMEAYFGSDMDGICLMPQAFASNMAVVPISDA